MKTLKNKTCKHLFDLGISLRHLDIIRSIMCANTNAKIGCDFGITEKTVKFHLTKIYKIVGVKSRLELFAKINEWENV